MLEEEEEEEEDEEEEEEKEEGEGNESAEKSAEQRRQVTRIAPTHRVSAPIYEFALQMTVYRGERLCCCCYCCCRWLDHRSSA